MRKICLSIIVAFVAHGALAQPEFGVLAGGQTTWACYSTPELNLEKTNQKTEMKFGFQLGGTMRSQIENKLYFSPAAFYSLKGFKVKLTKPSLPPDSAAIDNDVTLHTFELALMLQYNFSNEPGHFFIKGGPSLDIQMKGKEKFNKSGGGSVSRNMKFSFGDYGYLGANLLLHFGYETGSGLVIFAHYSHGVGNIVNADSGPHITHRAAGISIAKYFSRK